MARFIPPAIAPELNSVGFTDGNFSQEAWFYSREVIDVAIELLRLNPFDLKAALLAKHAQHVVLIHFPIALSITAVAFDAVAQWTKRQSLADAAYYNFLLATISMPAVLATGLLAWQFQLGGQRLKGLLLLHLTLACASTAMVSLAWWVHFRARRSTQCTPGYRFAIEATAVAVVVLTAHLGGFLSGVNGLG